MSVRAVFELMCKDYEAKSSARGRTGRFKGEAATSSRDVSALCRLALTNDVEPDLWGLAGRVFE